MNKAWLKDWPWETITAINSGPSKEKNALHKPTSEGHEPARKLWEDSLFNSWLLHSLSRLALNLSATADPPQLTHPTLLLRYQPIESGHCPGINGLGPHRIGRNKLQGAGPVPAHQIVRGLNPDYLAGRSIHAQLNALTIVCHFGGRQLRGRCTGPLQSECHQ